MFNEWIEKLLDSTSLSGFYVLILTFPLALIQGISGVFPFSILILLNVTAMGLADGLFTSLITSILVANIVFLCCRSFFSEWFNRKIKRKEGRFEKWEKYFELYGVWTLILLRTLPIIPNNVITLMASLSSIKTIPYFISSIVGNISQIWLFGIISASILMPNRDSKLMFGLYIVFWLVLIILFLISQFMQKNKDKASKEKHVSM